MGLSGWHGEIGAIAVTGRRSGQRPSLYNNRQTCQAGPSGIRVAGSIHVDDDDRPRQATTGHRVVITSFQSTSGLGAVRRMKLREVDHPPAPAGFSDEAGCTSPGLAFLRSGNHHSPHPREPPSALGRRFVHNADVMGRYLGQILQRTNRSPALVVRNPAGHSIRHCSTRPNAFIRHNDGIMTRLSDS
jgi:hypothetical protein